MGPSGSRTVRKSSSRSRIEALRPPNTTVVAVRSCAPVMVATPPPRRLVAVFGLIALIVG